MGKKKSSGNTYVSKGERPNVSQQTLNRIRRSDQPYHKWERSTKAKQQHRSNVLLEHLPEKLGEVRIRDREIAKLKGKAKENYDKIHTEEDIYVKSMNLFKRYGDVATWSACVQAVKTDWVEKFQEKCRDRR